MVLWQHVPGKDAQFHTPLPQPTLKLQPLQMKCFFFFFVTFAQTACFLFSEEFDCGEGGKKLLSPCLCCTDDLCTCPFLKYLS